MYVPSFCPLDESGISDTLKAMSTASTWISAFTFILRGKKPTFLGEVTDSRAGTENSRDQPATPSLEGFPAHGDRSAEDRADRCHCSVTETLALEVLKRSV